MSSRGMPACRVRENEQTSGSEEEGRREREEGGQTSTDGENGLLSPGGDERALPAQSGRRERRQSVLAGNVSALLLSLLDSCNAEFSR